MILINGRQVVNICSQILTGIYVNMHILRHRQEITCEMVLSVSQAYLWVRLELFICFSF